VFRFAPDATHPVPRQRDADGIQALTRLMEDRMLAEHRVVIPVPSAFPLSAEGANRPLTEIVVGHGQRATQPTFLQKRDIERRMSLEGVSVRWVDLDSARQVLDAVRFGEIHFGTVRTPARSTGYEAAGDGDVVHFANAEFAASHAALVELLAEGLGLSEGWVGANAAATAARLAAMTGVDLEGRVVAAREAATRSDLPRRAHRPAPLPLPLPLLLPEHRARVAA
jgi:ABC-type nitrate/sulfonate/bicarbonate transport system substrate-binding protein